MSRIGTARKIAKDILSALDAMNWDEREEVCRVYDMIHSLAMLVDNGTVTQVSDHGVYILAEMLEMITSDAHRANVELARSVECGDILVAVSHVPTTPMYTTFIVVTPLGTQFALNLFWNGLHAVKTTRAAWDNATR